MGGGLRTYGWINLGLMFAGLLGVVFGILLITSKAQDTLSACSGWCMNEYEYLCDDTPPLFLGLALIFALVVLASIPSCFHGCGASCACPNEYFRLDDDPWDSAARDAG